MRSLVFQRVIGAGSFGVVYLAEFLSDNGFRRAVAVKVMRSADGDADMFVARIRDEARLLGLLQDDSILKVLDMVRVSGLDAVLMEYVEGVDLDRLCAEGQVPPPRALCELGAAAAGALSRAHLARHPVSQEPLNVIHRDVKPANLMVTRSGGVKLLDFGVARARFDARESRTGQLVVGTLNYMAPEYIVTGEVSPAADVYGLGLTLWQVASGEPYGQPKTRKDTHEKRLALRLEQIRGAHSPLASVLEHLLLWDPQLRPSATQAEAMLLDAADASGGSGLRSWSRAAVEGLLARRTPPADPLGLLGHTVPISSGGTVLEAPAAPVRAPEPPRAPAPAPHPPAPAPPAHAPPAHAPPAHAPPAHAPPPHAAISASNVPSAPAAPPPPPPAARPPRDRPPAAGQTPSAARPLLGPALIGLLAGGLLGLIVFGIGIFFLLA